MTDRSTQTQTFVDTLDPARARGLQATLDQTPTINTGDALPPFFHQIYFWDPMPASGLGRDGHPKTGGFIPDMGLPRRMWAAGRMQIHRPLLAGIQAEKRSSIESVTRKDGRTGPLAFVRIRHDLWQRQGLAQTEWQEIVYRHDPSPDTPTPVPPTAPHDETVRQQLTFGSTALFRYSALTFNGHRIHYDADYARSVEGYAGLVVHGPLLAQMLMLLAQEALGRPLTDFRYRATGPLIADEPADFCWRADGQLWVRGSDGRQCMSAEAS
jgi:3-methylfumaryl-CoA hydratase